MTFERLLSPGPFYASYLDNNDPYELSNGHPIVCMPTHPLAGIAQARGAALLATDPNVEEIGTDIGFELGPKTLRAPDVAVLSRQQAHTNGWVKTAPPLALEYAGPGQNWEELRRKIGELLGAGTRQVWVVRVDGPRRVEVYENGQPMRKVGPGEDLVLEGVLANPIPVEALYDPTVAERTMLRNLFQRAGYRDLAEVREEGVIEGILLGKAEGKAEGQQESLRSTLLRIVQRRFGTVPVPFRARLTAASQPELEEMLIESMEASLESLSR